MRRRVLFSGLVIITLLAGAVIYVYGRSIWVPVYQKIVGKKTVADVVSQYGENSRLRLKPFFDAAGVQYPPKAVTLLGIKDTEELELWADTSTGHIFIRSYPIQALSGISGPKLSEGDRQVPEGFYSIEGLNPNSLYHLSMKLNYPNAFDKKHAAIEGRDNPGTNIFIHGKALSVGCLAMGDAAIEELFILAADVGYANIKVVITPSDPRIQPLSLNVNPQWLPTLYQQLNEHFQHYKRG
ncbi:MAG: hypothetical protein MI754_05220 [Chromatiales bacterium]|nr:hypothetical protein [Chromatiales bacterium]